MLNTYDNFTLNSIFRPKAFIIQYFGQRPLLFNILAKGLYNSIFQPIETSTRWWNRDYVVDIEVHVFSW